MNESRLGRRVDARLWAALGVLSMAASVPAAQSSDVLQIRAQRLVLADGTSLEDGVLVVEDGRIRAVGSDLTIDESAPWFEHDGVLTAGWIACQSRSGAGSESRDAARSLMPAARMAYAYDGQHSDFERALAAGITAMVLTPAPDNLVGGVTAVVKTTGALLEPEAHLSLSFSGSALGNPGLGAAADGGLERTDQTRRGSREPTSYSGALRLLRGRFAPEGRAERDGGLFERAASGELPVLLEAWNRHEVVRAAAFAAELGLRGAVRGAPLAGDDGVLEVLQGSGLGVIVGPYTLGQRQRSLASVQRLHGAGVDVAFALDAPGHAPEGFRLSACLAVSAGAEPAAVLESLTQTAAGIAGVSDRVGSLEAGKDADFVLWSGDPLNLSSRVEAVYVDGALAWKPGTSHDEGRRQ